MRNGCSLLRKVQARLLHVHGSRFGKDLELWKVSRWPKRKIGWTCKTSYGRVSWTEAPSLERMYQFPERRIEARWCKHALQLRWFSSVKMIMYLISSANDCSIWRVNEINLESRRDKVRFCYSDTKSLGERHSASTSTLRCWNCLKLCSASRVKTSCHYRINKQERQLFMHTSVSMDWITHAQRCAILFTSCDQPSIQQSWSAQRTDNDVWDMI